MSKKHIETNDIYSSLSKTTIQLLNLLYAKDWNNLSGKEKEKYY